MEKEVESIVQDWLGALAYSADTHDLEAHMRLVSRQVKVTGLSHLQHIDYDGWLERRRNEFESNLLRSLSYRLRKIIKYKEGQIVFAVRETMKASNGKAVIADKDVLLHKEEDGCWRVRFERYGQIQMR